MKLPRPLGDGVYVLEELIGEGGMAQVYRARVDLSRFDYAALLEQAELSRRESRRLVQKQRPETGLFRRLDAVSLAAECERRQIPHPQREHVAVKVLGSLGEQLTARFEDEWITLLGIRHPHVIEVYGGGRDEDLGRPYYAMELLERPLGTTEMGLLALADRLELIRQAALGLFALHERGIIHRDVKPDNFLCQRTAAGLRVVIGDLGVAKDIDRSVLLTHGQPLLGTPYYMAPEMARGSARATVQSDIYSLGASLYVLACGRPPYMGYDLLGILMRLTAGEPPARPSEASSVPLPAGLEALILRMMAVEPSGRQNSLLEVLDDLDALKSTLQGASGAPASAPAQATVDISHAQSTLRVGPQPTPVRRVLVVEDDEQMRSLLIRTLTRNRMDVSVASDGAQALLMIGQHVFDVILSDVSMPNLDGLLLLKVLKQQGVETPLVLLTGSHDATLAEQAVAMGAAGFLTKPFDTRKMVELLESLRA